MQWSLDKFTTLFYLLPIYMVNFLISLNSHLYKFAIFVTPLGGESTEGTL
jgi:hypothetical protein